MTWFEKIKTCRTPEELAALLKNRNERSFCPRMHMICGVSSCRDCIVAWLSEDEPTQDGKSAHPDGNPK
ncbi:hypothetical protein D7X33_08605 [Butyricicoccus sp. 1XD8-22]|nr:hypothetical protein D7X33_08605 [Butyricicoccus sp. 1XD8-22]